MDFDLRGYGFGGSDIHRGQPPETIGLESVCYGEEFIGDLLRVKWIFQALFLDPALNGITTSSLSTYIRRITRPSLI